MSNGNEIQIMLKDINEMLSVLKDEEESKKFNILIFIILYLFNIFFKEINSMM